MRPSLACAAALLALGCTFNKSLTLAPGPRERRFEHAPYFARLSSDSSDPALRRKAGYYVLWYQSAGVPFFSPKTGAETPIAKLVGEMNTYLDSLADSLGLVRLGAARIQRPFIAPDVRFGCERLGDDACSTAPGERVMRLSMNLPSPQWTTAHRVLLDSLGAGQAVMIVLEVGNYWISQTNFKGSKAVEVGTEHMMPVPWLSDLHSPVSALQVTGTLLNRDGKAIALGAEGILVRRTPFKVSALIQGSTLTIRDADVQEATSVHREDLPGQPLAWKVALRHLVVRLNASAQRRD